MAFVRSTVFWYNPIAVKPFATASGSGSHCPGLHRAQDAFSIFIRPAKTLPDEHHYVRKGWWLFLFRLIDEKQPIQFCWCAAPAAGGRRRKTLPHATLGRYPEGNRLIRCGAMNHPARSILGELEAFAGLGFDFLELTLDPPEAHYSQVRRIRPQLLQDLQRWGMDLVCHMPTFVSLADLTDRIRQASLEEVLLSLEAAAGLQPQHVVLHPAHITAMGSYVTDLSRQYALDSLAAIAAKAGELGLAVCLENMFPRSRFCVEPDDFQQVFARFPALNMTLDIGHGCIGSSRGKRVLQFIERFAARIHHLHVSDNFGRRDDHLPVGSGSIPFATILRALKEAGFNRTVTFEVFSPDRRYLRDSRRTFEDLWSSL